MNPAHNNPFEITQIRAPQVSTTTNPLPAFYADSLCKDSDEYLWDWSIEKESPKQRRARIDKAKEICAACPLMTQCRDYALSESWASGVWGGEVISPRRHGMKKECEDLAHVA